MKESVGVLVPKSVSFLIISIISFISGDPPNSPDGLGTARTDGLERDPGLGLGLARLDGGCPLWDFLERDTFSWGKQRGCASKKTKITGNREIFVKKWPFLKFFSRRRVSPWFSLP